MRVQAIKQTTRGNIVLSFESDSVGAINTNMKLGEIQAAIEEVCQYLGSDVDLKEQDLTNDYVKADFIIEDPEQFYFAMSMLVQRGIINYNPTTIDGIVFGEETLQGWTKFGGRLYTGEKERSWTLAKEGEGYIKYISYKF